jgi:hypothetical protein
MAVTAARLQDRMIRLARMGNVLILITPRRVICSNLSKEQGLSRNGTALDGLLQVSTGAIVSLAPE